MNVNSIKSLIHLGLIPKCDHNKSDKCDICVKAKITWKPFSSIKRHSQKLGLIHSDICELNGIITRGGKRYFITFIDDNSRFTYVYLMHTKDEALSKCKSYVNKVDNQLALKVQTLRSDRGGEYTSKCEVPPPVGPQFELNN